MDQIESFGVLLVGVGLITGSIATIQDLSIVVLPSVFLISLGVVVTVFGKYH